MSAESVASTSGDQGTAPQASTSGDQGTAPQASTPGVPGTAPRASTVFSDLGDYIAIPRLTSLRLAPDGSWLAATVQALGAEPKKFTTSIWRIDVRPQGAPEAATPVRLTRSARGESDPRFLPDGSLLFVSARREPESEQSRADGAAADGALSDGDRLKSALWVLPAAGGEACKLASLPGGVGKLAVATAAPGFLLSAPAFVGTVGAEEDAARRKARSDAGVTAILHEQGPVRFWDHDLGPDQLRLLAGTADLAGTVDPVGVADLDGTADAAGTVDPAGASPQDGRLCDLTPEPGRALDDLSFCLSPDGTVAVTGWRVDEGKHGQRVEVVAIDVATTSRQAVFAAADCDFREPSVSPDGRLLVAIKAEHDTMRRPGDVTLVIAGLGRATGCRDGDVTSLPDRQATSHPDGDAAGHPDGDAAGHPDGDATGHPDGEPRDLLPGFDRRPLSTAWAPDSRSVYFTADDAGRTPVYRVDVQTGAVTKITTDDAAYDNLCPAPDGRFVYALRSSISEPPAPVRIDASSPGAPPARLASPAGQIAVPGHVREVRAVAQDGTPIRGWLVLPAVPSQGDTVPPGVAPPGQHRSGPAPLLLWVHGGPVMSWSGWSWRWNPWLMAARGYAVLLPDPALSTGYGQGFIARGHQAWGDKPYTDVMALTDVVVAMPEIDSTKTAMMGGSFGGYMANWIAGHTDRFAAIVSHAGLWALDQMFGTTDLPYYWRRAFGHPLTEPGRYAADSPHLFADKIVTPILIIHGDKDYRVSVDESLRMYADLAGRSKNVKFLYFAGENHWILKPGDIRVWYETIFAFLAEHVLGAPWRRPELL
jgi:dipeptidyl aminopeptidase/acylaminoacyl peptidase